MGGVVGFASNHAIENKQNVIMNMLDAIVHRGPDNFGIHMDDQVNLGLRSIKRDTLEALSEPIYNEDRSCVLVVDGAIFNGKDIKADLIKAGHVFNSENDLEVIIHAYEEYGLNFFEKLRGMFSFAIWDKKTETLILARDIFGIKPLFYSQNTKDHSFLFGSEIKSFLKYPTFMKELNEEAIKPYLSFQYSVLDETFFKGVYKLKPGHYLVYKNGDVQIKPFWDIMFNEKNDSLEEYVSKIKRVVKESVDNCKGDDVNVGSFLSGGIDSSYITALANPTCTFSIGFKKYEGIFNETNLAEQLSSILKIDNYKKLIDSDEFFDIIPTIQYHMDEPHSNLSSVPLYFLAQMASEHVPVVMSGEGADEIFGGYAWYQESSKMKSYKKLPFFIRRSLSKVFRMLPTNRMLDFIVRGGEKVEETFIGQAKIFEEKEAFNLLKPEYRKGPSLSDITNEIYEKVKDKDDLTKKQYLDLHLWLPGDILVKADRMSMAHSLQVHVPFLDKEVLALGLALPSKYKVTNTETKYALRLASNEVLPTEWSKRKKVGFPVPIVDWLREEKYYQLVKEKFQSKIAEKFFNTKELLDYLNEHFNGNNNYARRIWTVYVFLIWYEKFFVELQ